MQGAEFEQVYDFGNLYAGFLKARRGKRHKPSVAKFEANLLEALCLLSEMLKTKTYRPSDYFVFKVYEPKERIVMTNAFKDKVVQHSLCDNILEPAFSKAFIRDNYASQSGRGTHDGLYRLEEFMRSYYFTRKANAERERRAVGLPPPGPEEVRHYSDGWVLKCDISKYFYSIQHEPLKQMTRKYIKDPDILWLVDLIVDSTENPGIPIGNQTSQWFAVMYLSGMDHFIKEKLGIRYYGRYMDDFYLTLMRSADGQRLMQLLSGGDGGRTLQQAAGEAAAGNTLQMAQMLKSVMSTPEGAALLRRIRDSLQG